MSVRCPHDERCPCATEGLASCDYEGVMGANDACPNHPVFPGEPRITWPHCHVEGCDWRVDCLGTVGSCGLIRMGAIQPIMVVPTPGSTWGEDRFWSMNQAQPDSVAWACGFLRTPSNVGHGVPVEGGAS